MEEQEYFGEVLVGIKQVIQSHLHDVQGKFQERFRGLEQEVRRRDDIISQLQGRIQELERQAGSGGESTERELENEEFDEDQDIRKETDVDDDRDGHDEEEEDGDNDSDASSADHPFMVNLQLYFLL